MAGAEGAKAHASDGAGVHVVGIGAAGSWRLMMEPDKSGSLDLSQEEMRELGYRVVDFLVDRHTELRDQPVIRIADRATVEALLREPVPEEGSDPGHVL